MPAASRPLTQPHADRLPANHPDHDEIILRHAEAIDRGEAGYLDPATGLFVISAATHLRRGSCCANGCRHCPYV
jgi:hypothetical protein